MKNKKELISTSSTDLEINGEKIIVGFQSKNPKKSINVLESFEKELFKQKKAIVQIKQRNKVIKICDIEAFLITQAMGPIQQEVSLAILNSFSKAYNRFKKWENSQFNVVKILLYLMIIPFMSYSQDINGNKILSVNEIINAFNDLDDFKNTIIAKFDVDTILYDVKIESVECLHTVYSINNEGFSGILVCNESISIITEGQLYLDYYDSFYSYLNEHCIVTMRVDSNYCTYDDWECEDIFWNVKVYKNSVGGAFFIRNKHID